MSASIEDAQAILLAFSKKYPFLKTDFFRAGSARLFNRIMNEARAGKVLFDLVAVRGLETHQLVKAGLLQPYVSPESAAYPAGFKDSKGNWVDYFDSYNVIGYNTQLVAREQAPKSCGRICSIRNGRARSPSTRKTYPSWYGAMTQKWGKEKTQRYMRALAKQDIQLRNGQTLIAQLMAAGEFSVAMVLAHRIEKMKEQGAPVAWVTTLDPGHSLAPSDRHRRQGAPSECRKAVRRLHSVQRRPAAPPFDRAHAGATRHRYENGRQES